MANFLDFIKASRMSSRKESSSSSKNLLSEARIVSSKNQFWPEFTISQFLLIAEYSSQWNSKSDVGSLKVKATSEQFEKLHEAIETLKKGINWTNGSVLEVIWKKSEDQNSSILFRVPGPSVPGFEEEASKILAQFNSSDGCQATFDKVEKPLMVKDSKTGKNIKDPSGKTTVIQALLKARGPKDKIEELDGILKSANIQGAVLNTKHYDPNQMIEGEISGDYQRVVHDAYFYLTQLQGVDQKTIAEYANSNFEFKQDLDDETKWLVQCAYKSIHHPDNTDDPHFDSIEKFCEFLAQQNVSLAIRKFHILRGAELKTLANKQEEFKKEFLGKAELDANGKPVFDKDELKAKMKDIEVQVKSGWKIGRTLLEVPSIKTLLDITEIKPKDQASQESGAAKKAKIDLVDTIEFADTPGGRCAARRMKLFAAAEKRGAKVYKTSSYVAAVCTNAKQVAPFGRLKPKVKPGTNEIDPDCNLEDWEGITPENKAKRDDKSGKYETIRDGIDDGYGHNFDRLTGEAGQSMNGVQFAESAWCVCGSTNGSFYWGYEGSQGNFSNYTEGGKRPMIVFMPTSRGALYLYAKFLKNGSILENILNENEKCDGDSPKSSNPSDSQQQQFCKNFEMADSEFKKIKNYLEKVYYPDFDPDIDEEDPVFDSTTAGGRCAQRRMKLFAAAEHYGAKIIKTKSWIAAVCTSGSQCHQFARLKPIVKHGTNEIDPDCNLEDWEGITPENKAKRDDYNNGDRIRDGIDDGHGKSFDRLQSVSSQSPTVKYAESAWCVSGACSNEFKWNNASVHYFDGYSENGKYAITVFMSTKRGAMYMYSNKNGSQQFDNESDCIDGSNHGNPPQSDQVQFLNKMKVADPEFSQLHSKICTAFYKKTGSGNQGSMTPEQLLKDAQENGYLTKNGWLKIVSNSIAKKYQPIYDQVAGLRVESSDSESRFDGVDLTQVSVIDFCNKVFDATEMFRNANIGSIRIINSSSLKRTCGMFYGAILENLEQIDMSSVEDAHQMFLNARPSKGQPLSIPALNLQKCRNIRDMFQGTNIQNIKIQNVQNVEEAYGAYFYCQMLASYPETKFPKIFSLKKLTVDGSESAAMMFPGCQVLQSKKMRQRLNNNPNLDFNAAVEDTENWYANKEDPDMFDSRGFFRVKSVDDISNYYQEFRKYPGVVIEFENAKGIFKDRTVNVKVLDLSHVKDASEMFYESKMRQIQDILGTETIEKANYMFCGCSTRMLPDMVFSSLVECQNMFKNCNSLKQIPEISITGGFKILDKISFKYLFYSEDSVPAMLQAVGGLARVEDWINKQKKSMSAHLPELLKFHGDTKMIEVGDRETANYVAKNWSIIKSGMGAEGIYVTVSNAAKLFSEINSCWSSSDGNIVLPVIDGSEITIADRMFADNRIKRLEGLVNFKQVTSAARMFSNCRVSEGSIPLIDTSKLVNAEFMFYDAKAPEPIAAIPDFGNLKIANGLFQDSKILPDGLDIGSITLPKAENCSCAFKNIVAVNGGAFKLSKYACLKSVNCYEMFSSIIFDSTSQVGSISLPEAVDIRGIFSWSSMKSVQEIYAPKAKRADSMFFACKSILTIGTLNLPQVTSMTSAFESTSSLQKILIPRFNASGYNFDATNAFKKSNLINVYGAKMEKWKSMSSLFALMTTP